MYLVGHLLETHYFLLIFILLCRSCLLSLCSLFPLFDIQEHFPRLLVARQSVYFIPWEPSQHSLEYVPHFLFELVLVIVGPFQKCRDQFCQLRTQ